MHGCIAVHSLAPQYWSIHISQQYVHFLQHAQRRSSALIGAAVLADPHFTTKKTKGPSHGSQPAPKSHAQPLPPSNGNARRGPFVSRMVLPAWPPAPSTMTYRRLTVAGIVRDASSPSVSTMGQRWRVCNSLCRPWMRLATLVPKPTRCRAALLSTPENGVQPTSTPRCMA